MNKSVQASFVSGSVQIPSSKSYFQRALVAASLSVEKTIIRYNKTSKDVDFLIAALRHLGHQIEVEQNKIIFEPNISKSRDKVEVNFGESGLASRIMLPVLAALGGKYKVEGEGSILKRPFDPIIELLQKHEVKVISQNGRLPIEMDGQLYSGHFEIEANLSSQYATGLLMAMPILNNPSTISIVNPKSWPYIEMTLQILKDFNINPTELGEKTWKFKPAKYKYQGTYNVEGDWSGASFWIVAAAISGNVTIEGLNAKSLQADKAILEVLDQINVKYKWVNDSLIVESSVLKPFAFDATDCPDLFPALATLAACTEGKSAIKGVSRLKHKESDRASALQSEFEKIGVKISIENDVMLINGKGAIKSGEVSSHNDHRIAMALAVASLKCEGKIEISGAESVAKSYADFWEDWEAITQ